MDNDAGPKSGSGEPDGEAPDGLLIVGRIGRPHGIRGDVAVTLLSDRPERLAVGARLWAAGRWLTVESARLAGSRHLVRFSGVNSRDDAARLTSVDIAAQPVVDDDPDVMWVHDLIGSAVVQTDGTVRGRCVSVIANPAADLLELDSGALVPLSFVVDYHPGSVTIDPPEGLFELFETPGVDRAGEVGEPPTGGGG